MRLYAMRQEAAVVPFVEKELDDWKPAPRWCHDNVDRWVQENPGSKIVRGWVLFDLVGLDGVFQFTAHSVVEQPDGTLIDITPTLASRPYRFLSDDLGVERYEEMIRAKGVQHLRLEMDTGGVIVRFLE